MSATSTLQTLAPLSAGVLLGAGGLGAIWIMKGAPALEPEDRKHLLIATVGILSFLGVASFACTRWNVPSVCESVPKWPF